jgi:hypothetical protein
VGKTERVFGGGTETHPINVFKNDELALSLHSLADFANNDNSCLFTKYGFTIRNKAGQIICQNSKDPLARLWAMPPIDSSFPSVSTLPSPISFANLFVKNELDADYVRYSSACFGSPPDSTFYRASLKGWLSNYPRLTPKMIHQNRPNSIETHKGHLSRLRQNLRSSNIYMALKVDDDDDEVDDDSNLDLFNADQDSRPLFAKFVDVSKLTPEEIKRFALHSDATGRFPFESFKGNNYILVSVFLNYIHVEPLPDRTAASYIKAFRNTINFFKGFGFPISIQRLDNESSKPLESFFATEARLPFQYISPNNKRANRAERAISSFKNHLISSFASVSKDFPMALWDELLYQLELTLAHLRPFALNPDISSYEGLFGKKNDFLAHPIAPVGIKVLVYETPDMRSSFANHGLEGFYLRPSEKHYRNFYCYIPSTNGFRDADQCAFLPERQVMPGGSKEEILINAINDLKSSLSTCADPAAVSSITERLYSVVDSLHSPLPPNLSPDPQDSVQRVSTLPSVEINQAPAQRVVPPVTIAAPPVVDVLRAPRRRRATPADPYRPLLPTERSSQRLRKFLFRIGERFRDTETNETFVIDSVVMPITSSGPGSRTPFYKMFSTAQYAVPTLAREFEYTPCSEINSAQYVEWLPREPEPTAAAILSSVPRDPAREPNQTLDGKQLNFKRATFIDPALWLDCDIEEYIRLFDSDTLVPVFYNQIPDSERGNIAYYNQQVKEKVRIIDGKEFIESRVRGTFGGNVFKFLGPVSANTAAYSSVKLLFNSILSDRRSKRNRNIKFVSIDLVDHYLATPLTTPAYMKIPVKHIPQSIIDKYNLMQFEHRGFFYFRVMKAMYGHPAAGRLANELLVSTLNAGGYTEDPYTPCLFHHSSRPTKFTLVVDDLGVKVHSEDDLQHLISTISKVWTVKVDREGKKFLGMHLHWEYDRPRPRLTIDAPSVCPAALKRFCRTPPKLRSTPTRFAPRHGISLSQPIPAPDATQHVQAVCGTFSHYSRVVDHSMLPAVSNISRSQASPTSDTLDQCDYLLGYARKHPANKLIFEASDMQLRVMYDASYQSLPDGRSRVGHIQYLTDVNDDSTSVKNIFHAASQVLRMTPASVVEAEYGSAFEAGQATYPMIQTLEALGHPQGPIKFFGDNEVAVKLSNNEVKAKRSRAIEKSYHWFRNKCDAKEFESLHIPGEFNVADYFTKEVSVQRHSELVPHIVHVPNN